jgi:uncharacterized SAM-binding protein YcdF (DUF218 family)
VFFVASKLLQTFLLPSNMIGLMALVGLLLMLSRWLRLGRALLAAAMLLLLVVGWSPVGKAALAVLENRFPQPAVHGDVAGIIVLGGEINTHISFDRKTVAVTDAGERLTAAAELSRRHPNARVILSGGIGHLLIEQAKTESAYARDLLVHIGVPENRIELEERSRNTCENAFESKAVANPAPGAQWLLVTSANHMPRAIACFRIAQFPVVPYPVDFRTQGADIWRPSSSIADGLQAADIAAHEWLGLAAYSLGKGTELFPSP